MKEFRSFTFDAKKKASPKKVFSTSKRIEAQFERSLKKVAVYSAKIVKKHTRGAKLIDELEMKKALEEYAAILTPWAEEQSKKLVNETTKKLKNEKAYFDQAKRMGELLSEEFLQREIQILTKELFLEQVGLIKSIPIEAGERAQRLALEAVINGRRAGEIASELARTEEVTMSRAVLIARTETSRTNAVVNKARAQSVGSTHYVWRNMEDGDVRESHRRLKGKKLDGQVFSWDRPPTLDDGMTGHPGTFPNCRCYAEPVLPEE